MKSSFIGLNADFVGFSASLLCAIHCAALPLLISLAPLAGLRFLHNPWIEYSIIVFSFFIASYALSQGYRRFHANVWPMIVVVAGFLLIAAGHAIHTEWSEAIMTPVGALTVASAHLVNWRLIRNGKQARSTCPNHCP